MTKETLKLALEALELHGKQYPHMVKGYCLDAITAIKEALAQPEQEPIVTLDYLQGHQDGLDWAADLAVYDDPRTGDWMYDDRYDLASAIRKGPEMPIAQPAQEPVAFENWHKANYVQNLERYGDTYKNNHVRCRHQGWLGAQSFLPQRTWVGLTNEERAECWETIPELAMRKVEAKLKEKNNG